MQRVELSGRNLIYLGRIDDKVVQYGGLRDPRRELLQALFFSTLFGDPLVLNDGYLLHSAWGRKLLTDEESALRKLNRSGQVLLAARDERPYSQWIPEQAEQTHSYKLLNNTLTKGMRAELDSAWEQCRCVPWPRLNVQHMMQRALRSHRDVLLEEGIAAEEIEEHASRWEEKMLKQTVRAAWESAMLDMGGRFREHERAALMGFANEAYHASFACGLSGNVEGHSVGIAGYGVRRLMRRAVYRSEPCTNADALLCSEEFKKRSERLEDLATLYLPTLEEDVFGGSRLEELLNAGSDEKQEYRKCLQNLFYEGDPVHERLDAFENALRAYSDCVRNSLEVKRNRTLFKLVEGLRVRAEWLERYSGYFELTCRVVDRALASSFNDAREWLTAATPAAPHVYDIVQSKKVQRINLLPDESSSAFELALDDMFVENLRRDTPVFTG